MNMNFIRKLPIPKDVKEQLSQLIEAQRMAKKVTNREFMDDDMDDLSDMH